MKSYQTDDIEAEKASLLSSSRNDEATCLTPMNSSRGRYIVAASIIAILITIASTMQSQTISSMKFLSLWTDSTPLNDSTGSTIYLDRHTVNCKENAGIVGFRLGSAPGWKMRENYGNPVDTVDVLLTMLILQMFVLSDCTKITLADTAPVEVMSTPYTDDGGGNTIFLDRHFVACKGNTVLNSFRYTLHPDYWRGNKNTHYEYTCIDTGYDSFVHKRSTSWQGGGGGNAFFLDRSEVRCETGELLQSFRYVRNPHNGDEYRYDVTCKKSRPVLYDINSNNLLIFLKFDMLHFSVHS